MTKHTFKLSDVTGDTRGLARAALGYDWNYLADAETFLFGSSDETAFRMQNMTAGTGITEGSGTLYKANVCVAGDLITTTIIIYLDGLIGGATAGDIIGVNDDDDCHLGQITAALNGTIFAGTMECLQTPAGGEPDIDLYTATVSTGGENDAISGETGAAAMLNTGQDWSSTHDDTASVVQQMGLTAYPAAASYLYLVASGGGDTSEYTGGVMKITLYGYPA